MQGVDEPGLGRGTGDGHRAGVRGVGEQRAQQHDVADLQLQHQPDQLAAERPPPHVRLDPVHQDDVLAVRQPRPRHPGGGPGDAAGLAVAHLHDRAGDLEVVVVVRIELGDGHRLPGRLRWAITPLAASPGVVPPSKAATSTGSTSSGTLSSSTTRCLLPTPWYSVTDGGRHSRGGGPGHDRWLSAYVLTVTYPTLRRADPALYARGGTTSRSGHLPLGVVWTISTSQGSGATGWPGRTRGCGPRGC